MVAKAMTRPDGQREAPRQEHTVTPLTPGKLKLSDIRVTKTAKLGELIGNALWARAPSPALECDSCNAPIADLTSDVIESLVPCSTLRVRGARARVRKCVLGSHFTCCSSRSR